MPAALHRASPEPLVSFLRINNPIDPVRYAPFILIKHAESDASLLLFDPQRETKTHVFKNPQCGDWNGNGYDWSDIAQMLINERLPGVQGLLSFTPDNRMFAAYGPHWALERLGEAMSAVFHDDAALEDLLSRADCLMPGVVARLCFWGTCVRQAIARIFK